MAGSERWRQDARESHRPVRGAELRRAVPLPSGAVGPPIAHRWPNTGPRGDRDAAGAPTDREPRLRLAAAALGGSGPWGRQASTNFKLIPVTLRPFGRDIVSIEEAEQRGLEQQVTVPASAP